MTPDVKQKIVESVNDFQQVLNPKMLVKATEYLRKIGETLLETAEVVEAEIKAKSEPEPPSAC